MELRYMGFDQERNARAYRFDVLEKGQPVRHVVVTAELGLFLTHGIRIQEGPALCARKLGAGLENIPDESYELTGEDLRAHAAALAGAEERRAAARKSTPRRPAPSAQQATPWRNGL